MRESVSSDARLPYSPPPKGDDEADLPPFHCVEDAFERVVGFEHGRGLTVAEHGARFPLVQDVEDDERDATRLYVAGKYFGESVRESANVSTLNANHAPP